MDLRKCILLMFLLLGFVAVKAATVDTVSTYSPSMRKNIKAVVIRPDAYTTKQAFPVVYMLHGHGDNYAGYVGKYPELIKYADLYNMIIVCADGNVSSWYLDSPVDSSWKYETYVAGELVDWIDKHFSTIKSPSGRAITGLSMGGHGALYLAFKHQDVFGAAGSMSGGVDIRPFPLNWNLAKRLGPYAANPEVWDAHSVSNLTHLLTPKSLAMIIDCGTDDFFYQVNETLHEKLLARNIPHDYISRPGGHNRDYWRNAIGFQMMFMDNFFRRDEQ